MVIIGRGVDPNIEWLRNSGIGLNRGVLVDQFMRTNADNIFAAGDVTEGKNILTGEVEVMPGWGNARAQGRIAGLNMMGRQERYAGGFIENISTFFGLTVAAIGLVKMGDRNTIQELKFSDPRRKAYRNIFLTESKTAGAVLVGITEDVGIIRNLIRKKTTISRWKEEIATAPLSLRSPFIDQLLRR
jgi:NAD(P)H-nitrite reductase large subunit